jgi:protein associated with RNAse G/E
VKGSQLDLEQLKREIRKIEYWHPLFKLLKEELTKLGYWKNRQRGNPSLGYAKMKHK